MIVEGCFVLEIVLVIVKVGKMESVVLIDE